MTALLDEIFRLLLEYLNACVQASCTGTLTQPVSLTPVSFVHLCDKLCFIPYHSPARLHPTLQALVQERDMRRVEAGLPTPGGSEAIIIQLALAAELKRAGRGGVNGGGGGGGVVGGERGRRLQRTNNADAGSGTCQVRKGTLLTNLARISVLNLSVGENTRDFLRNVALPTLGGSVW